MQDWVKDLLAKRNEDRNAKILRLSMLGWTQEEIGQAVGLSKEAIKKKGVRNAESCFFHQTAQDRMAAGIPVEDIATQYGWGATLTQALALEGKSGEDPTAYVLSANIHRRHMTRPQRKAGPVSKAPSPAPPPTRQ